MNRPNSEIRTLTLTDPDRLVIDVHASSTRCRAHRRRATTPGRSPAPIPIQRPQSAAAKPRWAPRTARRRQEDAAPHRQSTVRRADGSELPSRQSAEKGSGAA